MGPNSQMTSLDFMDVAIARLKRTYIQWHNSGKNKHALSDLAPQYHLVDTIAGVKIEEFTTPDMLRREAFLDRKEYPDEGASQVSIGGVGWLRVLC